MIAPNGAPRPASGAHPLDQEWRLTGLDLASTSRPGSSPFGALYNHREIGPTQLVSCFSEIDLADIRLLAGQHGEFGLGFIDGGCRRVAQPPFGTYRGGVRFRTSSRW